MSLSSYTAQAAVPATSLRFFLQAKYEIEDEHLVSANLTDTVKVFPPNCGILNIRIVSRAALRDLVQVVQVLVEKNREHLGLDDVSENATSGEGVLLRFRHAHALDELKNNAGSCATLLAVSLSLTLPTSRETTSIINDLGLHATHSKRLAYDNDEGQGRPSPPEDVLLKLVSDVLSDAMRRFPLTFHSQYVMALSTEVSYFNGLINSVMHIFEGASQADREAAKQLLEMLSIKYPVAAPRQPPAEALSSSRGFMSEIPAGAMRSAMLRLAIRMKPPISPELVR